MSFMDKVREYLNNAEIVGRATVDGWKKKGEK